MKQSFIASKDKCEPPAELGAGHVSAAQYRSLFTISQSIEPAGAVNSTWRPEAAAYTHTHFRVRPRSPLRGRGPDCGPPVRIVRPLGPLVRSRPEPVEAAGRARPSQRSSARDARSGDEVEHRVGERFQRIHSSQFSGDRHSRAQCTARIHEESARRRFTGALLHIRAINFNLLSLVYYMYTNMYILYTLTSTCRSCPLGEVGPQHEVNNLLFCTVFREDEMELVISNVPLRLRASIFLSHFLEYFLDSTKVHSFHLRIDEISFFWYWLFILMRE